MPPRGGGAGRRRAIVFFGAALVAGGAWAWATGRLHVPGRATPAPGAAAPQQTAAIPSAGEQLPPAPGAAPVVGDTLVRPADTAAAARVQSPLARVDRLAGALQHALRAYAVRAATYDTLHTGCAELAAALVAVDNRWLAYNVQGKGRAQGVPFDPARARTDTMLYASVDSVDRHFDGTGCQRP